MDKRGFASGLVLIIVVAALIVGAIWYSESSHPHQKQDVSVETTTIAGASPLTDGATIRKTISNQIGASGHDSTEASTPGTITAAIKKPNWDVYTNSVWGFSIEYPASYTLNEEGLTDATNSFSQGALLQITDPRAPADAGAEFDISLAIQPLVNNGPLYSSINSLLAYDQNQAAEYGAQAEETYKKVQINGADAIQSFDYNISGDSLGPAVSEGYDFLGKNTVIYSLSWSPPTYGFFSEVASTFKFLPQ